MQSPFFIKVRRGVGGSFVLSFYLSDGKTTQNVSAATMFLKLYSVDASGVKTLRATYTLTAGTNNWEKIVTFLVADVAAVTTFYAELDVNNPPTDGAYGFVVVEGK